SNANGQKMNSVNGKLERRIEVMASMLPLMVWRRLERGLLILCLGLVAGSSTLLAQDGVNYCEPSGAVKDELKKLPRWNADEMSYKLYQERRLAALEKLAQKYPGNFHVRRHHAQTRLDYDRTDREALVNEFRALMGKNPNDPADTYFYAKTLVGKNTKEAIASLDKLAK